MTTGAAATWRAQFIDEAYNRPAPANPNDKLGTYVQFRKDLTEAFAMFDSVGDALDELRSLRKKKTESIDKTSQSLRCWQQKQRSIPRTP
jgi:hypothetical protein